MISCVCAEQVVFVCRCECIFADARVACGTHECGVSVARRMPAHGESKSCAGAGVYACMHVWAGQAPTSGFQGVYDVCCIAAPTCFARHSVGCTLGYKVRLLPRVEDVCRLCVGWRLAQVCSDQA